MTEQELAKLYDDYGARIHGYVLALVSNNSDAEEIMQDVFAAIFQRRRVPRDPERYLFRAARNAAYSHLRWRRVRWKAQPRLEYQVILHHRSEGNAPWQDGEAQRALLGLPVKQREVVVLKVFQGMTFEEIGDMLEVSPNTAASRYRYAMEKLRASLDAEEKSR